MTGIQKQCPGCGRMIPYGTGYCDACRPRAEQRRAEAIAAQNRRYNSGRDPKYVRFYRSKEWRTISAAKLNGRRECEAQFDGCAGFACEVHHIKPIKTHEGWAERLEWGNLMSVCVSCHNKLDGKWGRAARRDSANNDGVIDLAELT